MSHEKRKPGRRPSDETLGRALSQSERQANRRAREAAAYLDALELAVQALRLAVEMGRDLGPASAPYLLNLETTAARVSAALNWTDRPAIPKAEDYRDLAERWQQIAERAWSVLSEVWEMTGTEAARREIVSHDSSEKQPRQTRGVKESEWTIRDDPRQPALLAEEIVSHDFGGGR